MIEKIDEIPLSEEETEALKEILSGKVKVRKVSNEEFTYNIFKLNELEELR